MSKAADKNPGRRYRGRTKEELSAERRERLLKTGKRLIARNGYTQTSIERICATAHVSPRYFYEHFETKEALLVTLFEEFFQDLWAVVMRHTQAATAQTQDPVEQTLEVVRSLMRYCMTHPARARIALVETVGISPEMEQRRRQAIRQFAGVIAGFSDRLASADIISPADYHLPAIALVGATNELLVEWLSGATHLTIEQMEQQVVAIYRAVIEGAIVRERRRRERARQKQA